MTLPRNNSTFDQLITPRSDQRGFLDRSLSLFAEVHSGEGLTAILLMLNVFLLLTAYYIIKTVREPLILAGGGAEIKSYAGAGQALLLLFIVPCYSFFASRVNRIRLIQWVTLFFISNLILFYFLAQLKVPLGVVFFLWVGIFNLMVTAQFWAFANDIYTQEQGKRLFAIVGFGSSLGAIFGAKAAGWLFKPLGAYQMMLVAGGILGICICISTLVNQREKRDRLPGRLGREVESKDRELSEKPLGKEGGFQLVIKHRYLLLIALMMLILNFVNTTGEFMLSKTVTLHAQQAVASGITGDLTKERFIGEFYADFFFWVNLLGALLQLFVVSRIFKYLGVRGALFFLPLIALGGYTLLAFIPILYYIRVAKILENSTDYSVQNTARHALFLPTSREAKYKAKAAIDTFFWRTGDALSAVLVFVGTRLSFNVQTFATVNILLVMIWLFLTVGIARHHKALTAVSTQAVP